MSIITEVINTLDAVAEAKHGVDVSMDAQVRLNPAKWSSNMRSKVHDLLVTGIITKPDMNDLPVPRNSEDTENRPQLNALHSQLKMIQAAVYPGVAGHVDKMGFRLGILVLREQIPVLERDIQMMMRLYSVEDSAWGAWSMDIPQGADDADNYQWLYMHSLTDSHSASRIPPIEEFQTLWENHSNTPYDDKAKRQWLRCLITNNSQSIRITIHTNTATSRITYSPDLT